MLLVANHRRAEDKTNCTSASQPSVLSIIVTLTPSVSGAGQVSMGTGVDTETGSELQTENTVSLPVPRPDSHPPPSWFPGVPRGQRKGLK